MEQKEALHKFTNSGQTTVIQILKAFSVLTGESLRHYLADRAAQYRQRTGELGYYQFMAEKSGKSIITLPSSFNQPVNLERLREVLAEHGVAFAFRQYDGKTDLLFRFQDKEVINKAMDDLLKDIHDPDAKLWQDIVKDPDLRSSVAEEFKQAEKHTASTMKTQAQNMAQAAPTAGKGRTR
ncbi:hypothetical protein R55227_BLOPHJLP_01559 [Fructobacillus tropaeoli]|uniref:PcfB protein n=1 Tax=Fructobacillus tropaeoli TaxID=709323 RepID=A0ABN9YZ80_9LACO|nr:hypothetical protein LMG30238_FMBOGHMB_00895 [Fructobacillus tropaeoli]CAK1253782.1 hypothetical protein R55227_BLOPHJLP_01559 [Fructobacillus tropaeoli]CAK1254110.1 hypothetical protein R53137_KAKDMLNK_01536 [Fructobacillus tropaeoli]